MPEKTQSREDKAKSPSWLNPLNWFKGGHTRRAAEQKENKLADSFVLNKNRVDQAILPHAVDHIENERQRVEEALQKYEFQNSELNKVVAEAQDFIIHQAAEQGIALSHDDFLPVTFLDERILQDDELLQIVPELRDKDGLNSFQLNKNIVLCDPTRLHEPLYFESMMDTIVHESFHSDRKNAVVRTVTYEGGQPFSASAFAGFTTQHHDNHRGVIFEEYLAIKTALDFFVYKEKQKTGVLLGEQAFREKKLRIHSNETYRALYKVVQSLVEKEKKLGISEDVIPLDTLLLKTRYQPGHKRQLTQRLYQLLNAHKTERELNRAALAASRKLGKGHLRSYALLQKLFAGDFNEHSIKQLAAEFGIDVSQ